MKLKQYWNKYKKGAGMGALVGGVLYFAFQKINLVPQSMMSLSEYSQGVLDKMSFSKIPLFESLADFKLFLGAIVIGALVGIIVDMIWRRR